MQRVKSVKFMQRKISMGFRRKQAEEKQKMPTEQIRKNCISVILLLSEFLTGDMVKTL